MLPLTPWIHTVPIEQRKVRESNPQNALRRLLVFETSGPAGYAQTSQRTVGLKGVEPLIFPVSEGGSTTELQASRVGGSRTHTSTLKRRVRCLYATTPIHRGRAFVPIRMQHSELLACHFHQVARRGVEPLYAA